MDIFLHESADKTLNSLDKKIQASIKEHLRKLADNPYSRYLDIKKLKGLRNKPDMFRLRVGEYRIIYFIQASDIWITEIMIREKGYDF